MIYINDNMNSILQQAIDKGIINISDVQEQLYMSKINDIISQHKYKIWQGDNGFWYTYLSDNTKKNGRRLIKKKSLDKIHEAILDFYENESENRVITFKDCFSSYKKLKSEVVSNNTLSKYDTDYKRYFKYTWIENADITKITGDRLDIFIQKTIKELELKPKAAKALIGYIKSIFTHAIVRRYINENPCIYLNPTSYYLRNCVYEIYNTEDRIANQIEVAKVVKKLRSDYKQKPDYIVPYAVELAMYTGMRVGEISALTWDSIKDNVIIINKEEIYDRIENKYYIVNYSKNKKPRIVPITKDIERLLEEIKTTEELFGFLGDYIFMNKDGHINKRKIGDCARNKAYQAGVDRSISIHCYRRTINSTIRCDGTSSIVASSIIGNTPEVNSQYYTYDVSEIEEKRNILEKANKKMMAKSNQ